MLTLPLIFAALAAGLAGGVHCLGMCGGLSQWLLPRAAPASVRGPAPAPISAATAAPAPTAAPALSSRVIAIVPAGGANAALASCAGSAVASATHWQALLALHAGRLGTYALIGALAGATGGLGLMWHPLRQLHWPLLLLGNLALLYLGLRVAGVNLPWSLPRFLAQAIQAVPAALQKITRRLPRHPFFKGMAWGCMPCGLLATVLPFALLSGSAWSGAVLLILFGMGTLPYLLALQLPPQFRHHPRLAGRPLRMGAALLLCAWAVFGLLQLAGWVAGPMAAWCVAG